MKLYYSKGACSLAIRVCIHEIGIPCEFEAVDLKTKKTETGSNFLNINPKGSVPVLVLDNQEILTENPVIQQYLADEYKAKDILPSDTFERYKILEWLNYIGTELHKGCFSQFFNPKIPDSVKEEVYRPLLKTKLDLVDQHLSKNKYLLNERYSLADNYLLVMLLWLDKFKIDISQWKHLPRYLNALKLRPGVQQSLKEEGLA